jgi:DNA-binding GntR family transcriptional regulator
MRVPIILHFRLTLSGSQGEALYRRLGLARQGGDHRKVERIVAMLALAEGLTQEAVAELFKLSVQTLRNWVQRLLSEGMAGLLRFNKCRVDPRS